MRTRRLLSAALAYILLSVCLGATRFLPPGSASEFYTALAYLPPLAIFCLIPSCRTAPLPPPEKAAPPWLFPAAAISLTAGCFLISLLTEGLAGALGYVSDAPSYSLPTPLIFLAHGLLPAILEELLFREILIGQLFPLGRRPTICITAIAFALIHSPLSVPYALFAGLLLGWLRLKSRTPIPCIAAHLVNNCVSISIMLIGE